jgi:pimeloyl-ACP methyl ester carboxylesterase
MFTRQPVPSFRRAGIGCLSLLLTLGCAGAIYQWGQSRLDRRMNPAPGQLIDVGGYRIHIYCVGGGSPTVVLDSGLSDSSLSWDRVQPEIAKFTRVCAYDRAGLGWSDPSPKPRNSKVFAEELHTLLHNAGIPVPYVFVGHSMGGFDALIYARLYSPEVAGMVLVDSPHPDFANRLPELRRGLADWRQHLRWQQLAMPFGIPRLMGWCGNGQPELQSKLRTIECNVSRLRESIAECSSMWGESASQARSTVTLGEIPLVVLSEDPAKNVKEFLSVFEWGQQDLMHLSPNSSRITAVGSGHQIQKERPDLVVAAVQKIVEEHKTFETNSRASSH